MFWAYVCLGALHYADLTEELQSAPVLSYPQALVLVQYSECSRVEVEVEEARGPRKSYC